MKAKKSTLFKSAAAALLAAFSVNALAEPDLLPLEEAFKVDARQVDKRIVEIDYFIAPGYRLYRDQFRFSTDNPAVQVSGITMPPPLIKADPLLGNNVAYYSGHVTVRVTLSGANMPVKLVTKAQGCADIGVCYPPISKAYSVPAIGRTKG